MVKGEPCSNGRVKNGMLLIQAVEKPQKTHNPQRPEPQKPQPPPPHHKQGKAESRDVIERRGWEVPERLERIKGGQENH